MKSNKCGVTFVFLFLMLVIDLVCALSFALQVPSEFKEVLDDTVVAAVSHSSQLVSS